MSNLFVFITISHLKNATCSFFVRVTVLSFAVFLPSASFSCRRGVSRVNYLTLLVMCSHYPWDSSGFLACLSSLYLPLLSLPHSFFFFFKFCVSSHIPPFFPPPSTCPGDSLWHWQKDLSRLPLNAGSDVYHGSAVFAVSFPQLAENAALEPPCIHACISKSNVYKADNLSHFSPLPVLQARVSQIRHLSVTEYICLQTHRHVNELANNCEKRG